MEELPHKPNAIESESNGIREKDPKSEPGSQNEEFEVHKPAEALLLRLILQHAGYDTLKLKDGEPLDKEAKKLLHAQTTQKRFIFQHWPRNPNGKTLTETNSMLGKTTQNGVQIWGETLFDLYYVNRSPDVPGLVTISSGSKLAGWMKKHDELEWAAHQIAFADREASPKQVPPFDIAELIEPVDMRLRLGLMGKQLPDRCESDGERSPQTLIHASVFDPALCPKPWPIIPFSYDPPRLQAQLPYRLLPKKLIVHDPWSLLAVGQEGFAEARPGTNLPSRDGSGRWTTAAWPMMQDVTREYHLSLSSDRSCTKEVEKESQAESDGYPHGFILMPEEPVDGPVEPPIFVRFPPKPRIDSISEAHLYLSPEFTAGKGHHSVVYHAEWEVPRSMLMPPKLCQACVMEDLEAILKETDGKDGSRKASEWKKKNSYIKKETYVPLPLVFDCVTQEEMKKMGQSLAGERTLYTTDDGSIIQSIKVEGSLRRIDSRVQWQMPDDPSNLHCSHFSGLSQTHPRTTKVRVIAKLSIERDPHLLREALNYQKFPKHFFEHWSGYNVVPPLTSPTPVGAVVPQFYGIYKSAEQDADAPYLSPILLLEDCGMPVEPGSLNVDDQQECQSLYYRFHLGDWLHESVAARNIVMAPGCISDAPLVQAGRQSQDIREGPYPRLRFRLIDFGRSRVHEDWRSFAVENMYVSRLFEGF